MGRVAGPGACSAEAGLFQGLLETFRDFRMSSRVACTYQAVDNHQANFARPRCVFSRHAAAESQSHVKRSRRDLSVVLVAASDVVLQAVALRVLEGVAVNREALYGVEDHCWRRHCCRRSEERTDRSCARNYAIDVRHTDRCEARVSNSSRIT